jgi:hypothetical protein
MRIEVYRSEMDTPLGTYYINLTAPVSIRYVTDNNSIDHSNIEDRLDLIDDDIAELQELIDELT